METKPNPAVLVLPVPSTTADTGSEPDRRDAPKRLRTGVRAGKNVVWAI